MHDRQVVHGVVVDLDIEFFEGKRHLPIVRLKSGVSARAAAYSNAAKTRR
jgi:hypothetical protein